MAAVPLTRAGAAPMDPQVRPPPGTWSSQVVASFDLLGDTDNPTLVYYVPRFGGVAVQAPLSTSPVPQFQIFARYPTYGFFAGEELTFIGGTLSTMSDLGALEILQAEAAANGLTITPAPATNATTTFMATGYELPDGRVDVNCVRENAGTRPNGTPIVALRCWTRKDPTANYDTDTNVMYKFASFPALNNSVVSQSISFQATTLPFWAESLRPLMATGGQWNNVLTAAIDWKVKTGGVVRQARFVVNWQQVFEQISAYAGVHYWCLLDADAKYFFQRLVTCSDENACGIRVEYLQADGTTWGPQAPNDADFAGVVQGLYDNLYRELLNEVAPWSTSHLGQVSGRGYARFTVRANYEKLVLDRNEVRYFTYAPATKEFNARTQLNIGCLLGGFEEGRVSWDMSSPGCRAILGQP